MRFMKVTLNPPKCLPSLLTSANSEDFVDGESVCRFLETYRVWGTRPTKFNQVEQAISESGTLLFVSSKDGEGRYLKAFCFFELVELQSTYFAFRTVGQEWLFSEITRPSAGSWKETLEQGEEGVVFRPLPHSVYYRKLLEPRLKRTDYSYDGAVDKFHEFVGTSDELCENYMVKCDIHNKKLDIYANFEDHEQFKEKVFVKVTFHSDEQSKVMNMLVEKKDYIAKECPNIVRVLSYKQIDQFDDVADFSSALLKIALETVRNKEKQLERIFSCCYSSQFITIQERVDVIDLKRINLTSIDTKLTVIVNWIGQCLDILHQLHNVLGILHGDISLKNLMSRQNRIQDNFTLALTDFNHSSTLEGFDSSHEKYLFRSVKKSEYPMIHRYPYTFCNSPLYGTVQGDIYAMGIVIAKFTRNFLENSEAEFMPFPSKYNLESFLKYGEEVKHYFKDNMNQIVIESCNVQAMSRISQLLEMMIMEKPSTTLPQLYEFYKELSCEICNNQRSSRT